MRCLSREKKKQIKIIASNAGTYARRRFFPFADYLRLADDTSCNRKAISMKKKKQNPASTGKQTILYTRDRLFCYQGIRHRGSVDGTFDGLKLRSSHALDFDESIANTGCCHTGNPIPYAGVERVRR